MRLECARCGFPPADPSYLLPVVGEVRFCDLCVQSFEALTKGWLVRVTTANENATPDSSAQVTRDANSGEAG